MDSKLEQSVIKCRIQDHAKGIKNTQKNTHFTH